MPKEVMVTDCVPQSTFPFCQSNQMTWLLPGKGRGRASVPMPAGLGVKAEDAVLAVPFRSMVIKLPLVELVFVVDIRFSKLLHMR